MKKTIIVSAVMIFTAFVVNAQKPTAVAPAPAPTPVPQTGTTTATTPVVPENPNAPEIIFEIEDIDYGNIDYDSDGNREFKFKNKGKEPLIIYNATGSCGCTVPDPASYKDPIMPGASGHIKVHYDTKRPGHFEKSVTVSSNSKTPSKMLRIHGEVKAAPTAPPTTTASPTSPTPH